MLDVLFAKDRLEKEEGSNHMLVQLMPEPITEKVEKPIAFVLVVDVSGSMSSPAEERMGSGRYEGVRSKLDFVKNASEKLLDMMKNGDMLGVISFSDIAYLEYPLTSLTSSNRFEIKDRIRSLQTRGSTNISDALEKAYQQVPYDLRKTHHIKLLLLSDGEANNGITDIDSLATIVNGYKKNDVSISSIGVGLHYNSYFMENISTVSGGMFYHLENMSQLETIFTSELETMATLTTKQASIKIEGPEGIHISANLNGFQEEGNGVIYIGNMFYDQEVVVEIFTTERVSSFVDATFVVTYEYTDLHNLKKSIQKQIRLPLVHENEMDNVVVNQEVVEIVKQLIQANSKKETTRLYENGDFATLDAKADIFSRSLDKFTASYSVDTSLMKSEMQNLHEQMKDRKLDARATKSLYNASYEILRNKNKK